MIVIMLFRVFFCKSKDPLQTEAGLKLINLINYCIARADPGRYFCRRVSVTDGLQILTIAPRTCARDLLELLSSQTLQRAVILSA